MDRIRKPSSSSSRTATGSAAGGRVDLPLAFGGFRMEADGTLFRGESVVHLPPRELAALRLLLANAGQIVTPSQLKQALWGNVHVTAESVPRCLSSLRARLKPEICIQTVYKRGYRLMAETRTSEAGLAKALPRLAIRPFVHEVDVPEHLGTAIADETIARLSNAERPLVSILARDSVFTLASRGLTAQQIGKALNADLVLAGTLRAFPAHFRLRVEMIRVADGVQIWVEDLLVERTRIAGLETDLASRLFFRLEKLHFDCARGTGKAPQETPPRGESVGDGPSRVGSSPSRWNTSSWNQEGISISAVAEPDPQSVSESQRHEAYELFLRGRHEWQTLERHRMQDGLRHLSRAIELDPSLIAAKADLVHLCVTQSIFGFMSPEAAANLVRRTVESIPDFSRQAQAMLPAMAWAEFHFNRNLHAALQAYELCANLPHDASVTRERAMFALSRNRHSEAIALLRAAIQQDPFSPWLHGRLGWALHLGGHASESIEQIEDAIRLFPGHEGTALYGSMILAFNGDAARGVKLAQDLAQRQPFFDLATASYAYALASAGRASEARSVLERLQWLGRERFVINSFNPAVHVALGDSDAALVELNAANDSRCPWFFQMLADPRLKPLHGRREFKELQAILPLMEAAAREGREAWYRERMIR